MKKFILTITMLLTLGFSFQGVAAQTPDATPAAPMGEAMQAEGLVSAYDRTYTVDFEAMMSSPSADMASPAAATASPAAEMNTAPVMRVVSITGITFNSEDNARSYLEDMKSQIYEAQEAGEMPEGTEVKDLEDFDKDGFIATLSMEDIGVYSSIMAFVDGDQVFMIVSLDADVETATTVVNDVATYIVDTKVENDEVTFNADGTSTGGVFDRMPQAGSDLMGNLSIVTDAVLQEAGE
jgi:hypothetical protein